MRLPSNDSPRSRPLPQPVIYLVLLLTMLGLYATAYHTSLRSRREVVGSGGSTLYVRNVAYYTPPLFRDSSFPRESVVGSIFAPAHYLDARYFRARMWAVDALTFPDPPSIDLSGGKTLDEAVLSESNEATADP